MFAEISGILSDHVPFNQPAILLDWRLFSPDLWVNAGTNLSSHVQWSLISKNQRTSHVQCSLIPKNQRMYELESENSELSQTQYAVTWEIFKKMK